MKYLAFICILCSLPAWADFTAIPSPDANYLSLTNYIDPSAVPDYTELTSITDGTLAVSLSPTVMKRTVPIGWTTWSSIPDSQFPSGFPAPVLWTEGASSLTMTLSTPVSVFGFEAEPDLFGLHSMVATFYDGADVVGFIPLSVEGNQGAALFAAATLTQQFTSITLSSDVDFAIAGVRYSQSAQFVPGLPEPSTVALLAFGLASLSGFARKRSS